MRTKEEVQAEVDAVNKLIRTKHANVLPCKECRGEGRKLFPVYGDWALGSEYQQCGKCGGSGSRLKFKR